LPASSQFIPPGRWFACPEKMLLAFHGFRDKRRREIRLPAAEPYVVLGPESKSNIALETAAFEAFG